MYNTTSGKSLGSIDAVLRFFRNGIVRGHDAYFPQDSQLISYVVPKGADEAIILAAYDRDGKSFDIAELATATSRVLFNGRPYTLVRSMPAQQSTEAILAPQLRLHYLGHMGASKDASALSLAALRPSGNDSKFLTVPYDKIQMREQLSLAQALPKLYSEQLADVELTDLVRARSAQWTHKAPSADILHY